MNVHNVIYLLKESMDETMLTPINDKEQEVASYMRDILLQCTQKETHIDIIYDLVLGQSEGSSLPVYDPEVEDEDFRVAPECTTALHRDIPLAYKEAAVKFWRTSCSSGKQATFGNVKRRFRRLTHERYLYRWEKQVQAGGTHREKLAKISARTLEKFMQAKRNHMTLHDIDIRRWALAVARELNCDHFKASPSWVLSFKKAHNIVSRKITKFVSRTDVRDREEIENNAVAFQLEHAPTIEATGPANCYNADQSGFQMELHSGRTLDIRGERKVERIVQSKNAMTHSFTVMPSMSAAGELKEPLYVVLHEPGGKFGPQVKNTMVQLPNLKVSCSSSGKMGKEHLREWMQEVFLPGIVEKTVLVVDSWSTFTEENIRQGVPENVELVILQIPPGATGLVQPWDVYGFRIWKNFVRHIEDFVVLFEIDITLHQRNNLLKIQSLVFNQLCSPRYRNVFKYSWYKAGLIAERPDSFDNPVRFAFRDCSFTCNRCNENSLLQCSWCRESLCFSHFFVDHHVCNAFVE